MINSVTVTGMRPFAGGAPFGAAGSYVRIDATAAGSIDPTAPAHRVIVALDLAPRNAHGEVEYETRLCILRPADPAKSNHRIVYEVVNRGRRLLFQYFCNGRPAPDTPLDADEAGDGLLLTRGFTIVWSGWDATLAHDSSLLGLRAPLALENGRPVERNIREEFVPGIRPGSSAVLRLAYEAVQPDSSQARLSMRRRRQDPETALPADAWRFADSRTVVAASDETALVPGALYDLYYRATGASVQGVGFAATRDVVSHLRHGKAHSLVGHPVEHVLALGVSQAGRYLRDHVALGFNRDEAGRRVFDGVLSHAAGAGRVFCNALFAQPFRTRHRHQDHDFPEEVFPFSTAMLRDPITGEADAILRNDGSDPLTIETNTSSEYWQKGASLIHTDPLGHRDLTLPENTRVYLIAGTQHDGNPHAARDTQWCVNACNPHDPEPVLRALLIALDRWVVDGVPAPSSRVPTLADGTLCAANHVGFPDVPGVALARECNGVGVLNSWITRDLREEAYRVLVCRVDADGNEVAGVRTPDTAVPIGSYTGWNVFKPPLPPDALADRFGSYLPFTLDEGRRVRSADPRPSLAARYADEATYVARVGAAAQRLVNERLLLDADAARYVERALALRFGHSDEDAPRDPVTNTLLSSDTNFQLPHTHRAMETKNMGPVYIRNGLFIGRIREADKPRFEANFRATVLPRLREFPGLIDVAFILATEREDAAPEICASLLMVFPSAQAARDALESPARASALANLQQLLPLFQGHIAHVCYTAETWTG